MRHRVALPLHPEYRTLPMVWYIPPLSPVADTCAGRLRRPTRQVFAAIDSLRIPVEYLANLFTAGEPGPVRAVLRKLAAVRAIQRAGQLGLDLDEDLPASVGSTPDDLDDLYRLLAIAKYEDRYVIPPAHAEDAGRLMAQHEQLFCSLDTEGGPAWAAPARTASRPGTRRRTRPGPTFRDDDGRTRFNLSAGTAGVTRRTFPRTGRVMSEPPRTSWLGAAAVPDRRAVRRPGRAGACRDHLAPSRPGRRSRDSWPGSARTPPADVAQHYVQTFDLRRRCALYLTYYRYGDTRKRGMAMVAFKTAYRDAGFDPCEDELPDYLPMVLDFAALHRPRAAAAAQPPRRPRAAAPRAARRPESPYADVVAAVCAQLPRLRRRELGQVLAAWESGPPPEEVGLEPFAPPDYLAGAYRADAVRRHRGGQLFWWVALPYLALGIFVVGHVWRWRYDQFGWTSRSTQLQERRLLKWGGPLFHYGTFAAIAGHVIGILIPERWTRRSASPRRLPLVLRRRGHAGRGADDRRGGHAAAGGCWCPGCARPPRPVDYLALILLLVIILTGIVPTIVRQPVRPRLRLPHHRRAVVPRPVQRLARRRTRSPARPFIYQVHATAAWVIWAVWPFSRLVHAWSYPAVVPVAALHRLPQPRRRRAPAEPGTGGRKWRKIGVPY